MDKTLRKGLRMIEVLAASTGPRGITDLALELDIMKSNAHRVLATLEHDGYVVRDGASKYKLSLKLWELGSQVTGRLDVKREAAEQMRALAEETRETVHLSILSGAEVVYLDKIDSPEPVRSYTKVGGRAPAFAVATGKVLLAFQAKEVIDAVARNLVPYTPKTLATPASLRAELARIRQQGFATNIGEWRESVCGVAAPIRAETGVIEAAIGISGPAARLKARTLKAIAPRIVMAAQIVSGCMGYSFKGD